jgi:membrane carboxypeptidase/penicillin-binding protein
MGNAIRDNSEDFAMPEGIVTAVIDPQTGLLSRDGVGIKEYFKEGTEPRQLSPTSSQQETEESSPKDFD